MATRSRIGIKREDGTIRSIYCHWDGYPEHNGNILNKHYTSVDKINQLLDLGDISVLAPEIGEKQDFSNRVDNWVLAYNRDRGQENVKAAIHTTTKKFLDAGEEYNYLFENGKWTVFS